MLAESWQRRRSHHQCMLRAFSKAFPKLACSWVHPFIMQFSALTRHQDGCGWIVTPGPHSQQLRSDVSGLRPTYQNCSKSSASSCNEQLSFWATKTTARQCKWLYLFLYYIIFEKKLLHFQNHSDILCPPWFQLLVEIRDQMSSSVLPTEIQYFYFVQK